MNKLYNKNNKKDRFITDHLLPYLMNHIEESAEPDETIESIAAMCIFPYKRTGGTGIGSLKEPGISWYFTAENDKISVSSGSYRIFDKSNLRQDQYKKIRKIFLDSGYIREFSVAAVVRDLIKRMSSEENYSDLWWTCAYDVFRLWKPGEFDSEMKKATQSMNNNCFLFDITYSGYVLKDDLIKAGIFRDIITPASKKLFWNKIPEERTEDAVEVLKKMGVPSSFVYRQEEWSYKGMRYAEHVNPYILRFAKAIGAEVRFPVAHYEKDSERCRLSHWLFMDIIWKESKEAFMDAASDMEKSYNVGIIVKNTNACYVPLSWDLFYSKRELQEGDDSEDQEVSLAEEGRGEERMEYLHIDASLYDPAFITEYAGIHAFSEVDDTAEKYYIDEEDTVDFYRWVWGYSKHASLAENILNWFTGDYNNRATIPEEENDFVLSVIENYEAAAGYGVEDLPCYSFDIDLQDEKAFSYAETINKISRTFDKIFAVVYGNYRRLEVNEYVTRILNVADTDFTVKSRIESDEIWKHIYLTDRDPGRHDGTYLRCKVYDESTEENYEDVIILWPSENEDSYVKSLAEYIKDNFRISVAVSDAEGFDWENEYLRMIRDIRAFVSENRETKSVDEINGYTAETDDVKDFGTEKRIWNGLKERREKIIAQKTSGFPVDLNGGRDFLYSRYKGRCQLCGSKIAMDEQRSYFWTYRMVKEHDNRLADSRSNLFCLCPACHGEMQYGSFMGKDMREVIEKAKKYASYIDDKISSEEFEDDFPSLIQELAENDIVLEGFRRPIICDVIVNGKPRHMAFSWEHFMRLSFIYDTINDYEDDEIKEPDDLDSVEGRYYSNNSTSEGRRHGCHGYVPWHGTEYVTGHWRTRNGQTEWVSGHWRTR